MQSQENKSEIICLESVAFYQLIEEVVERISLKQKSNSSQWVNDAEAMTLLGITSKTTLQKYRDEGAVRYTQPSKKVILYDRNSILDFLEKHAKDTF